MADSPNNTYFGIVAPGDIVTRARQHAEWLSATRTGEVCADAADEIERLRHQVDDLRRCLEDDHFHIERLRAAGDALALASTLDLCDCSNDDCMALGDAHRIWNEARQ